MPTNKKPIFYSWNSYVADILTSNIYKRDLWKTISEQNLSSGLVNLPCIFTETDPKEDKSRRRPIGKRIDTHTIYFCLTHFDSIVSERNSEPTNCKKSYHKVNYVSPSDYPDYFDLDDSNIFLGVWTALPPAISTEKINKQKPMVHVHLRESESGIKVVDDSFEAIIVKSDKLYTCNSVTKDLLKRHYFEIEITPPSIFSLCLAYYKKQQVNHLVCARCGAWHTDLGLFNLKPHKKHLCGSCGYFFDVDMPLSCSNALAALPNNWSSLRSSNITEPSTTLSILSKDYDKVEIWSWSPAAIWTMATPEVINGIHVHAYKNGKRVVDETFGKVIFDGEKLRWQDLLIASLKNSDISDIEKILENISEFLS